MVDLTDMDHPTEQGATLAGHLFVLSAANQGRLQAYAGKVVEWLEGSRADGSFVDAIYTWQVGRTTMRQRLAIKVNDHADLRNKLKNWLQERHGSLDTWSGEVSPRDSGAESAGRGKSGQGASTLVPVDQALSSRDWAQLGALWTSGADIDWRKLYAQGAQPRRISVPTYPFARERHWIEVTDSEAEAGAEVAPEGHASVAPTAESGRGDAQGNSVEHLFLAPVWEPAAPNGAERSDSVRQHHIVLCEMPEVDAEHLESLIHSSECSHLLRQSPQDGIAEHYIESAVACFGKVRELLAAKSQGKTLLQVVIPDEPEPSLLAGLSGLLKTAAQENPSLLSQIILTDARSAPLQLVEQLRSETNQLDDTVIRYVHGVRQILRWQPAREERHTRRNDLPVTTFRDDGVYLITGGLGGLGILFVREILHRAARPRIILTGRGALSRPRQDVLEGLSRQAVERGASPIEYRRLDIESREQVRDLVAAIETEHKQLNGIIHSAGMISDSFIVNKVPAQLRQVLAPKVTGTVNLDEASRGVDLDFLVLFSSVTAVTGHSGQADYAAANGFMDQFSSYRNRLTDRKERHGRTLSINWPLWQEGGMVFDQAALAAVRRGTGLHPMQTSTGLRIFHESLSLKCARTMVLEGDIEKLSATLARGTVNAPVSMERRASAVFDSRRLNEETLKKLKQLFAEVTKSPVARIDSHEELASYGVDSIIINTLNFRLAQVFGEISKTLFFEYKTLQDLTAYLTQEYTAGCAAWTGLGATHASETSVPSSRQSEASHRLPTPADAGRPEPVAIIGISGIYPQAATLDEFWANLEAGRNCIREIPPDRWALEGFYDPDMERALEQGKSYSKWGGFIDQFAQFDPLFFNISPREAMNMDPQERLFLQESWRALEDAGYTRADLKNKFKQRVGVFAGITKPGFNLYAAHRERAGGPFFPYTSFSSVANRVSYFLDITGPSMPVDTMCSSSLTAIHQACEYIHRGDCEMAFAGGVNLYLHPYAYTWLCSQQMLSRDGLCRSFGAGGTGYVPGEGVGVVLLKSLSGAIRDHDHIYGVILATHVNHGGKTNAYSVPNPKAQAELIRRAIDKAGLKATDISYIEAHGTGTELGDPIEISGLSQAFAPDSKETGYCRIGSAKSNIGHLEAAAGVAGLTKVLLQMKHGQLAPSLHATQLNPNIAFDKSAFRVNTSLSSWQPRSASGSVAPRTAGISSFGAAGANAHIIVQEYPAAGMTMPATSRDGRVIVPLSARTPQQLQQKVHDLLRFIETAPNPIDLQAMAYTLQVGREAMEERLGCLASSVDQLVEKLQAYLAGAMDIEDVHQGQVSSHRDTVNLLGADEDFAETLDKWLVRGKLSKLLELWTKGVDLEWSRLYGEVLPQRMALPRYPFAGEKYWVDAVEIAQRPQKATGLAPLHPLLHGNTSVLRRQCYSSVFTGEELFLRDHRVNDQKVLPGVAYLEMARAAMNLAAAPTTEPSMLELRNTVWAQPITVSGPKEVTIALYPDEDAGDGELIEFEIHSTDAGAAEQATLHCQGQAVFRRKAESSRLDLEQLKSRMKRGTVEVSRIYEIYSEMGVSYGPAHRAIRSIQLGEQQLLAQLRVPDVMESTRSAYLLHPSLMDGALQAAIALVGDSTGQLGQPLLPFALDTVRVVGACTAEMFAWVRYSSICDATEGLPKVDVDLCDQTGNVCVQMHGFTSRVLGVDSKKEPIPRLHSLVPVWKRVPRETSGGATLPESTRVLLIGGEPRHLAWVRKSHPNARLLPLPAGASVASIQQELKDRSFDHLLWMAPDVAGAEGNPGSEPIIERQEEGVLAVFRLAKALLNLEYTRTNLQWTLITRNTQSVKKSDRVVPTHAAIIGLAGSLAKEYPDWTIKLVDLDNPQSLSARECLSLACDARGNCLAYRQGEWFRQGLARVGTLPESLPAYRQDGVYVVVGGAGGIGEAWSRFMAENYNARLVWIGRRKLDSVIEGKIRSLSRVGHAPLYISADATQLDSLRQAFEKISAIHPAIHGVVHSAIDLQDRSVALMDEATFRAGLSAKVDASVNMDAIFGAQDLDFMLFFSSLISFTPAAGQSNYSAGCTFKDSFAHSLRQQHRYPVKIMNWGYWGEVGVVTGDFYNTRMQRNGVGSIDAQEGMDCLQTLVSSSVPQLALLKTLDDRALEDIALPETVTYLPGPGESVLPQAYHTFRETFAGQSPAALKEGQPAAETLALATEILASSLASAGLIDSQLRLRSADALEPFLGRWLSASLDYLLQQECTVRQLDEVWAQWNAKKTAWLANTQVRAHIALLEACLKALPRILTGKQRATDVMFPDSSMQLVEGVYRGHALADYCNDVLGTILSACIKQKLQADAHSTVRILEIGAGTGGTTARILPLLREHRGAIAEYCYTDVSKAFLMHAEELYRPQLPALTTAIFDVSKPLQSQSVAAHRYDFVIATNVLHATPDIRETLRNTKALLKSQGVLLLNEMSTWSLLSHLTFGLLEGWWLYEDEQLRLPASPGLKPLKWHDVLQEEGFESIVFPAREAHELGQQIIAAVSDGQVRQRAAQELPTTVSEGAGFAPPAIPARSAAVPTKSAAILEDSAAHARADAVCSEASLREKTFAYLQAIIAQTLRMDASQVAPDRPLADYGLDSILVVGLTNQLRKVFPSITSTLFFQVRNIAGLADYILEKESDHLVSLLGTSAISSAPAPAPVQEIKGPRPLRRGRPALKAPLSGASVTPASVDVAIIGVSGRYPQAANLKEFWSNLSNGRNCITEVPKDRWDWQDYFDPEKGKPGKIYTRWGGFLEGIDQFDPLFFRISPKEAKAMDPQERLFLQSSYHAIEDAGYTPENLADSDRVGVFVGVMNARYSSQPLYYSIANRVSFVLDFRGPSMAVDTACSSSLTAIHLALESIYSGSCECAIAGGVNLIIDPVHYQELSALTMLSAGNQCRSFADQADGFVDAEGVGAIVLKPLTKAEQDGDHIYGVIKASAVNAGGRTNGYTVPNPNAQSAVIAKALERANLTAVEISYIEAHGTGTALGDPIEIAGLSSAFARSSQDKQFCAIGSLKSNIGHCESAAGIAALTKVLLQLKHQQLVPSLHSEVTNPEIDFSQTPFRLQTRLQDWLRPRREVDGCFREMPRTAGISSFGAGGSNAHIIVQEHESAAAPHALEVEGGSAPSKVIIPLSARTAEQLRQKACDLVEFIRTSREAREPIDLRALAYTLQTGRESMEERIGFVVGSLEELADGLESLGNEAHGVDGLHRGRVKRNQEIPSSVATDRFIHEGDLEKLLGSWVKGVRVNWNRLYGEARPRRVSLPVYPFARERYWRELPEQVASKPTRAVLHPLLHRNVSDMHQQGYRSSFTGNEAFLTDHRITLANAAEQKVMPAAVFLEMARAAVEDATASQRDSSRGRGIVELFNIVWADPVVVTSGGQMAIALFARDDDQLDYEIYSPAQDSAQGPARAGNQGPARAGNQEIVHCQGQAFLSRQREPARIDLSRLKLQMQRDKRTPGSLYGSLADAGVRYGPAYRAVTSLYVGDGQLLAELSLPGAIADDPSIVHADLVLHPILMDGALQAACELISPANQPSLPLAVESLCILAACTRDMFVWVRYSTGDGSEPANIQLDLDLCDREGNVCVQMRGVTYERRSRGDIGHTPEQGLSSVRPEPFPTVIVERTGVVLSAPQSQAMTRSTSAKPTQISLGTGDLT